MNLNRQGVAALEGIVRVAARAGDEVTLQAVLEVLEWRRMPRATKLRQDVMGMLRHLQNGGAKELLVELYAAPDEQTTIEFESPTAPSDRRPQSLRDEEKPEPEVQSASTPLTTHPPPQAPALDLEWIRDKIRQRDGDVRLRFDETQLRSFVTQIQSPDSPEWFKLRRRAEQLALIPGFDELIALDANMIEEMAHQTATAIRVLRNMGGRAILADEVGLGKTIEAGLILKELLVRRLVKRILILCPASLVDQWQEEMEEKFLVNFTPVNHWSDWTSMDLAIGSLPRARHPVHRPYVTAKKWDLVIVDEAHKAKNHATANYQTIQEIERDYILLLTATPLQNDLREFYNLVTLVRPGQFGTWREFKTRYMSSTNSRIPRDPEGIRDVASQVMVRNKRANVNLHLPPRRPYRPNLNLTEAEAALYQSTTQFLRELHRKGFHPDAGRSHAGAERLTLIGMAQRLCSSSAALASSLHSLSVKQDVLPEYRRAAAQLSRQATAVRTHTKLRALSAILSEHRNDRIVVFSEHRPTLDLIARHVQGLGRSVFPYHGGLNRRDRARVKKRFQDEPASIFLSSRSGAEGLNLQFAHVLVNYELPWNPLLIEQRIGRLHRIGQKEEVAIYNLAAKGTVEDRILEVLQEKIHLFELVVGELDLILGRFEDASALEKRFADAWLAATDEESFEREVEIIGLELAESFSEGKEAEKLTSYIAPEDNADRLEREFAALSIPARIRLAYGTRHLNLPAGVEAQRMNIGLTMHEIQTALNLASSVEHAGASDYGSTVWVRSATGRGRSVSIHAAADSLPITILEFQADREAPLAASGIVS